MAYLEPSYKLALPNSSRKCAVFHALQLKRFVLNGKELFSGHEREFPGSTVTEEGLEEWFVGKGVDQWKRGRAWQYLVRWRGGGPGGDLWLPRRELDDCEALDIREASHTQKRKRLKEDSSDNRPVDEPESIALRTTCGLTKVFLVLVRTRTYV